MSPRRFLRFALHLLLAVGLVLPGIAAPAQAAGQALAMMSGQADAMAQSPCSGMAMPEKSAPHMPSGVQHGCDLAACLGAGCLPTLPHVTAFVPEDGSLITWEQPVPPSRLLDTLLRPPIA